MGGVSERPFSIYTDWLNLFLKDLMNSRWRSAAGYFCSNPFQDTIVHAGLLGCVQKLRCPCACLLFSTLFKVILKSLPYFDDWLSALFSPYTDWLICLKFFENALMELRCWLFCSQTTSIYSYGGNSALSWVKIESETNDFCCSLLWSNILKIFRWTGYDWFSAPDSIYTDCSVLFQNLLLAHSWSFDPGFVFKIRLPPLAWIRLCHIYQIGLAESYVCCSLSSA